MIQISAVHCGIEEEALVLQVLRSGMLAQGPMVERFEACCREMTGAEHAVAVSNGTVALVLALKSLGLKPGDEVITSPFTFVATLNAILEAGATVRFADIDETDFNIDPTLIRHAISERTKVIMPVHLYGQPADMDRIAPLAARTGITIVEDAAQAHGATVNSRPVGTYGLAAFSFYATKNLQSGEGGVITTSDAVLADRMRVLRNQGMRRRYEYEATGYNFRLTDIAAAIAIPQFDRLESIIATRQQHAQTFNEAFSGIDGLVPPAVIPGRSHVWHQYTLRLTAEARLRRDDLVRRLAEHGVGAGVYYPRAVYDYACFREHPLIQLDHGTPVAERVATEVVSLPVHQHLRPEDVALIIKSVRELLA